MTVSACPNASDAPKPSMRWYCWAPLIVTVG
jgi:hypothetical protein